MRPQCHFFGPFYHQQFSTKFIILFAEFRYWFVEIPCWNLASQVGIFSFSKIMVFHCHFIIRKFLWIIIKDYRNSEIYRSSFGAGRQEVQIFGLDYRRAEKFAHWDRRSLDLRALDIFGAKTGNYAWTEVPPTLNLTDFQGQLCEKHSGTIFHEHFSLKTLVRN